MDEGGHAEMAAEQRLVTAICDLHMERKLNQRPSLEMARADGMIDLIDPETGEVLATLRYQVKQAQRRGDMLRVPFVLPPQKRACNCYEGYIMIIFYNDRMAVTTNHALIVTAGLEPQGPDVEGPLGIPVEAFESWICDDDKTTVTQLLDVAEMLIGAQHTDDAKFKLGEVRYPMVEIADFRGAVLEMSPVNTIEHIQRRVLGAQLATSHGGDGPGVSSHIFGTGGNDQGVVDLGFVCLGKGERAQPFKRETGSMSYSPSLKNIDNVQAKSISPVPIHHNRVVHTLPLWHFVNNSVTPYHSDEPIDIIYATVSSTKGMIAGAYFLPTSIMKMMGIAGNNTGISCHPPLRDVVKRMLISTRLRTPLGCLHSGSHRRSCAMELTRAYTWNTFGRFLSRVTRNESRGGADMPVSACNECVHYL